MRTALLFILSLLLLPEKRVHSQICAPTPEAAALSAVGGGQMQAAGTASGFRLVDVQVDTVLRRVWLRVGRCDGKGTPLVLVPVRGDLSIAAQTPVVNSSDMRPSADRAALLGGGVHAGDQVTVVFSSHSVRMELQGTADRGGSVGESIPVTLRARGDEPPHRIVGMVRAEHMVEVQP